MKKNPKIENISFVYDKISNVSRFSLLEAVLKSNGEIDKKLIKDLEKNDCLDRLKKNLKANYKKSKIRRYRILLDNGNWVEGRVIGKSRD